MHIIKIKPIHNNPQTGYTLVVGNNVSLSKILNSIQKEIELRKTYGLITEESRIEMLKQAEEKFSS